MSNQVISRPISPLRRRMMVKMAMRGLCEGTQRDYLRVVSGFAALLGRVPDMASADDIRRFQVHQSERGIQPTTINASVSALRFLFTVILDRSDLSRRFVLVREPRKLPAVLSVEKVGRLLEAAPGPKHKAALGTTCGAGLRVSEVAALKVDDIDSTRMLIRVEQCKRRKVRNAMLSPQLLELLRLLWREGRRRGVMLPDGWLFPGRNASRTRLAGGPCRSRRPRPARGDVGERPTFSRSATFTSSSRCRPRSSPSPSATRRSSTTSLFKAASETMLTIAADPKHLGARIGITAKLHTQGSAMTHHPHIHMIVPGGGFSCDGHAGSHHGRPSCCRCGSSTSCSGGCS